MSESDEDFAATVKLVREQLDLSQENLAREIGVSFATVNRWENGKTRPFALARRQFDKFCTRMERQGKLTLGK